MHDVITDLRNDGSMAVLLMTAQLSRCFTGRGVWPLIIRSQNYNLDDGAGEHLPSASL